MITLFTFQQHGRLGKQQTHPHPHPILGADQKKRGLMGGECILNKEMKVLIRLGKYETKKYCTVSCIYIRIHIRKI